MGTKICSKCKSQKTLSEFGKDKTRKDGLSYLCKTCLIIKSKIYKSKNREKVLESYSLYRKLNKEKMKLSRLDYIRRNQQKITDYRRIYSNKKRKESNLVRIMENLRRRTNHILKNKNIMKKGSIFTILGCNMGELIFHLESKFVDGMCWDNHGRNGWHIDHIIPLSSARNEEELYELCHYTNLQPLWARDNLTKGSKIF